MFKFIITGFIVYFVYRFFIAPPVIDRPNDGSTRTRTNGSTDRKDNDHDGYEDEYIDYEEL